MRWLLKSPISSRRGPRLDKLLPAPGTSLVFLLSLSAKSLLRFGLCGFVATFIRDEQGAHPEASLVFQKNNAFLFSSTDQAVKGRYITWGRLEEQTLVHRPPTLILPGANSLPGRHLEFPINVVGAMLPVSDSHLYYANARFNGSRTYSRSTSADSKDNLIRMKCILKNQLHQGQLPNMPAGFPFHYVADGHGSAFLSENPFEFRQEYASNQGSQVAVVSFTDPATSLRSSLGCDKYVWRISLPSFEEYPEEQIISAEVQVDIQVMRSPYGEQIRKDPRLISKALATSLEYGLKINITTADYDLVKAFRGQDLSCQPTAGDIIYLGTNTKGQQQILNILDARAHYSKFSASP